MIRGGEKLLTLVEASQMLRLSRSRLFELHEDGAVPGHQRAGRGEILFSISELKKLVTENQRRGKR
jgi:predicted DNA-binding transcriptional regulator AlpA